MKLHRIALLLSVSLYSLAAQAGPFSTYSYSATPTWPTTPVMPASPTWPTLPSPPATPTLSTRSWSHSGYDLGYRAQNQAAQRQQELQLQMNDSPELVRSQQLPMQLQLEAFHSQDSAFQSQRYHQERMGAAPGLAAEAIRQQQEAALRTHNEAVLQNWRKNHP